MQVPHIPRPLVALAALEQRILSIRGRIKHSKTAHLIYHYGHWMHCLYFGAIVAGVKSIYVVSAGCLLLVSIVSIMLAEE